MKKQTNKRKYVKKYRTKEEKNYRLVNELFLELGNTPSSIVNEKILDVRDCVNILNYGDIL